MARRPSPSTSPRSRPATSVAGRRRRRRRVRWDLIAAFAVAAVLVLAAIGYGAWAGLSAVARSLQAAKSAATLAEVPSGDQQARQDKTDSEASDPVAEQASWAPGKSGQLVKRAKFFKTLPAPKGLAMTPDNQEVWVTALVTKPSIGIYDPLTGKQLDAINLGKSGAVEVIFNRDGTRAYASQMQTHRVYEIDVARREVLRKLDTGSPWTKVVLLSSDERKLYAANWSGDDVSEIDLGTGKVLRRIRTADTPRGLYATPDGKRLYVACFGEQTGKGVIQCVALKNGKKRTIGEGRAMRHMVADEKHARLFTSDLGANCIWVTDMKTNKTTLFAKTDNKPNTIDISPDGRVLFVSNRGANNPTSYNLRGPEWGSILLFDTQTGKPLDAIVGGNQCTALDVSADGALLAFSDFLDGRLRVYRVPPTEVLLEGKGGAYKSHLRKVRKDGAPLRVTIPSSVSTD